jgi:hypothetical protein
MSINKYESVKITVLKNIEYPNWRVKILLHLKAINPDYLDRIKDGPYVPTKLIQ